jgi:PAS domain S-box-containing protein
VSADDEESKLRAVALKNVESILIARQRAERELLLANERLEQQARELQQQRKWFEVTLSSIGDAVITTDTAARITFLNPVAETMTGWTTAEARGKPLDDIFRIVNEQTGEKAEAPVARVLLSGRVVGLANHTALVRRDGTAVAIEDSAAPIRNAEGEISGVVMVFHDVTARRTAEAALAVSQQRFRAVFEQAAMGIAVTDIEGRILEANPRFVEILGHSLDELRERRLPGLIGTDDSDVPDPRMRALLSGELANYAHEQPFIRQDGSSVWARATVTLLRNAHGHAERVITVVEDISERRVAEIALRDARARLDATLAAAEIGTWTWDVRNDCVVADRNFANMFGVPPEAAAGAPSRTFMLAIHHEDRARVEGSIEAAMKPATGRFEAEYRLRRNDGSVRWIAARGQTQFDEAGHAIQLPGVALDITERKHAEELRGRLAAVVESSDDAILSKDLDGIIVTWNRGAQRMFGYESGEVVGRSVTLLIPPELAKEEPEILRRLRRGERIDHYETTRVKKDGTRISVSLSVSPIRDGNGNVVGASKIARDITEQKRAESRQRELYDSAQREIQHRERAEAALRETDRRKDEFLATLAHELRNPLAPIRQAALISRSKSASEEQKQWSHDVITRQVHHMALLLDDLLDISRVTRGILELRSQMTNLATIVETAVETARPLIDAKRHSLEIALPQDPIDFAADPLRLAQILSNLLTNAAKYTDPEGRIRLSASATTDNITIRVTDSGIGIPPDALQEVFAMFSQVKSAQDRSEGGLGIGLALTKGLVKLHGGTIEVRSAGSGCGSEFIVQLPRRMLTTSRDEAIVTLAPAGAGGKRVLIADDNQDAADSLAMLLRMDGYEVVVVHDGREALRTIESFQPEIALLDIGMPEINGYEVARRVRQQALGQTMTLIAVTGWGQASDKARASAAGFNHHFTKPVEPETLSRLLRAQST